MQTKSLDIARCLLMSAGAEAISYGGPFFHRQYTRLARIPISYSSLWNTCCCCNNYILYNILTRKKTPSSHQQDDYFQNKRKEALELRKKANFL